MKKHTYIPKQVTTYRLLFFVVYFFSFYFSFYKASIASTSLGYGVYDLDFKTWFILAYVLLGIITIFLSYITSELATKIMTGVILAGTLAVHGFLFSLFLRDADFASQLNNGTTVTLAFGFYLQIVFVVGFLFLIFKNFAKPVEKNQLT